VGNRPVPKCVFFFFFFFFFFLLLLKAFQDPALLFRKRIIIIISNSFLKSKLYSTCSFSRYKMRSVTHNIRISGLIKRDKTRERREREKGKKKKKDKSMISWFFFLFFFLLLPKNRKKKKKKKKRMSMSMSISRKLDEIVFRRSSRPLFQIFAANTGLGKTLISAGLLHAAQARLPEHTLFYLKPVQTGFPADSDSRFVKTFVPGAYVKDLFTYRDPLSPHLAVKTVPLSPSLSLSLSPFKMCIVNYPFHDCH
jgi:hypothetical protein